VKKKLKIKNLKIEKTEKLWTGFPERKNVKGGREGCVESSSFKTFLERKKDVKE
jgi:hypothetical protein